MIDNEELQKEFENWFKENNTRLGKEPDIFDRRDDGNYDYDITDTAWRAFLRGAELTSKEL